MEINLLSLIDEAPPYDPFDFNSVPPQVEGSSLEKLLKEVGAELIDGGQVLRFKPALAGPKVDPERWEKALKLEALFFALEEAPS